jgi:predicted ester cyclase
MSAYRASAAAQSQAVGRTISGWARGEEGEIMSNIERKKAVVAHYVEAFNRGDMAARRDLFTADAVVPIWEEIRNALQIQLTVDDLIAEDERVAVRYIERGTFVGPFRGNKPTGKSYEIAAMEWFEFQGGKVSRRWGARDSAAQSRQIGMPLS